MEIFWIVIGIIYIVYRLVKDKDLKLKTVLIAILTITLSAICGFIYDKTEESQSIAINILGIMLCFIPILVPFLALLYDSKQKDISSQNRKEVIKQSFESKGYHIQDDDINDLLYNPISPLNSKESFTINECYRWLCGQRSIQIDNMSSKQISEMINFPYEEIPLNNEISAKKAILERLNLTKDFILRKQGLRYLYLNKFVDDTSNYAVEFRKYITKELELPKEQLHRREIRLKELDVIYNISIENFQQLLGYILPKCEYPFSNKSFREHRKMVAKWEILSKEGYIPQTDIEINMYGNWADCKRFMDRSYELYTIKHSDLELIYGAKLTDDLLKHRGEIIKLILLREGIKNDGFICGCPLTPAYEKEGAAEVAFELLKN